MSITGKLSRKWAHNSLEPIKKEFIVEFIIPKRNLPVGLADDCPEMKTSWRDGEKKSSKLLQSLSLSPSFSLKQQRCFVYVLRQADVWGNFIKLGGVQPGPLSPPPPLLGNTSCGIWECSFPAVAWPGSCDSRVRCTKKERPPDLSPVTADFILGLLPSYF